MHGPMNVRKMAGYFISRDECYPHYTEQTLPHVYTQRDYTAMMRCNFLDGRLDEQNVSVLHFCAAAITVSDTKRKTD